MKQCEKCLVFFTPPLLTHPNSYAASRCYDCYIEYINVILKCSGVKTRVNNLKLPREVQDE